MFLEVRRHGRAQEVFQFTGLAQGTYRALGLRIHLLFPHFQWPSFRSLRGSLAVPASKASRILHIVFCVSLGFSPFLYGYKAPAAVNVYLAAAVSLCLSIFDMVQAKKEGR